MTDEERMVARVLAAQDLYVFARWMFLARRGYRWQQAAHHKTVCDALMRVYSGETRRLIINIPPRYSKTELAVINFIAWAFGRHPDCEFIHAGYSATLAANNSWQIRDMVQHDEYRAVFPHTVLASEARSHWKTTAGGVMYASGAGGTITGFGAGKMREGFGGCFPVGTRVWTESGVMPIDEIVRNKMRVNVWAYDYNGNVELMPVTGWHANPPNDIVRVKFNDGTEVECTPCHRFWTENRGWVKADSLCEDDRLPRVDGFITCAVKPFISGYRQPCFIEYVRHDNVTFCLTVEKYHNFIINDGLVVKNCIIIDDPHKADEARSETVRRNVIDWFQNTIESRKNSPETPVILIMQRLHENDLAGWLLNGGNGEAWEHVRLPAIQADGTALWPEKHDIETLRQMEAAAPYMFAGQYMQHPAPPEGGMFKPERIGIIEALPSEIGRQVRGWDFAASAGKGDYTAGVKICALPDGRWLIADAVRGRYAPDERDTALRNTAAADGRRVRQSIPQDPGQAGKSQVQYLIRQLAGFAVESSPETGDKITRAEPFAAQVNAGNVLMLKAGWNDALKDEMRLFPNGAHDDQIDACSRAFNALADDAVARFRAMAD